jgi:serine/threonine protein kinase
MALESLKFMKFSSASDVWGYGVTLFELFTLGEEPWPNIGWSSEFMDELESGKRLSRPKFATSNM